MGRFHRHEDGTAHSHDGDGEDHSGYQTGAERVEVLERIFDENDRTAAANRALFAASGVRVVNLMSSPGAGKTTLLRETLSRLAGQVRIGIIEGDIETRLAADRLAGFGAQVALIHTGNGFGGECHLDAPMVRSALPRLPLGDLDLVLIENVGNLVCPAEFDVGEDARAMVYAITEGEEKPLKYPVMFRSCELVVVNKMDLLPHLGFDMDGFLGNLRKVNPAAQILFASERTCETARASVSAAVIMSAAWPAAARASITSVTESSGSRPESCASRPSSCWMTRNLASCSQSCGRLWPMSSRLPTMARTSLGLDSSPPPCVSSLSTVIACAAWLAISLGVMVLASSVTGRPRHHGRTAAPTVQASVSLGGLGVGSCDPPHGVPTGPLFYTIRPW